MRNSQLKTTHRQFLEEDKHFERACGAAGVKRTMRQASKFRRGKGAAFAARSKLQEATA